RSLLLKVSFLLLNLSILLAFNFSSSFMLFLFVVDLLDSVPCIINWFDILSAFSWAVSFRFLLLLSLYVQSLTLF
ncbi:hypothetical protein E1A91_D01G111700v1, partial [Gossypium mustelinum]